MPPELAALLVDGTASHMDLAVGFVESTNRSSRMHALESLIPRIYCPSTKCSCDLRAGEGMRQAPATAALSKIRDGL